MSRQGKCETCQVRYVWPEEARKLELIGCPRCGRPLRATTHHSGLSVVQLQRAPRLRPGLLVGSNKGVGR